MHTGGAVSVFVGLAQAFVEFVFFRLTNVPLSFFRPIEHANMCLIPPDIELWVWGQTASTISLVFWHWRLSPVLNAGLRQPATIRKSTMCLTRVCVRLGEAQPTAIPSMRSRYADEVLFPASFAFCTVIDAIWHG